MTSNYPSELDNDQTIPYVSDNITEIGAEVLNAMRDAILAIEQAIGTNPNGSTANLANRLSQSFNSDGTIKSSALIAAGLIALPITNSQIGASAGILESKLDLDVATQLLQDQISSNDVDIEQLRSSINQIIANFAQHVAGTAFKHDAYDILLDSSSPLSTPAEYVDLTAINVGQAIIEINNNAVDHTATNKIGAHKASNISTVNNFDQFNAFDVQEALEQLANIRALELIDHRDSMHANGYDNWANSTDGYDFNTQILPSTIGTFVAATILTGPRNVIEFTGSVLSSFRIKQGDIVVISGGANDGSYIIDDVGPRDPVGIKAALTNEQLEIAGIFPTDGAVSAQIYARSSLNTIKTNGAPTIHQSDIRVDSIQFARPNAAKVVTLGANPQFISGQTLVLEVGIGNGITRSLTITDLHLNRAGATASPVTIDSVVERINFVIQNRVVGTAFPAAAYRVGNEIAIAHNWSGNRDYTLKVTSSGSGNFLLGLDGYGANVVDQIIHPTENAALYIGGNRFLDFPNILSTTGVASGAVITCVDDPLLAGVKQGHLLHIKSHPSDNNAIGTYFIIGVATNSITIHKNGGITAGSNLQIEVLHDALPMHDLANNSNDIIVEAGINSNGQASYNVRLSYTDTISNFSIIGCSDNLLAGEYTVTTATSGSMLTIVMSDGVANGKTITLPSTFEGEVKLYSPSNIEYLNLSLTNPVVAASTTVTVNEHIDEEELLEVCTVKINGLLLASNIRDKRLFGTIGLDEIREDVVQTYIETPIAELRENGIVTGFDIISSNYQEPSFAGSIYGIVVRGGSAYVSGVRVSVPTRPIMFPAIAGTYYVGLDPLGGIRTLDSSDYTLEGILDGYAGDIATIAKVVNTASGPTPLTATDLRYFINNLDNKVDLILDTTNRMTGHFATAEAAFEYLANYPFGEKSLLKVVSRIPGTLTVPSGVSNTTIQIDGTIGTLSINSNIRVFSNLIRSDSQIGTISIPNTVTDVTIDGISMDSVVLNTGASATIIIKNSTINVGYSGTGTGSIIFENCRFVSIAGAVTSARIEYKNCQFIDCVPATSSDVILITASSFTAPSSTTLSVEMNGAGIISECVFDNIEIDNDNLITTSGSGSSIALNNCIFSNIEITGTGEIITVTGGNYISITGTLFTDIIYSNNVALTCNNFTNNTFLNSTGNSQIICLGELVGNTNLQVVLTGNSAADRLYLVSGNIFVDNSIGYGLNLSYPVSIIDPQTIVSNNIFEVGSGDSGILCNAYTQNILIDNNYFSGDGTAISLADAGTIDGYANINIDNNIFDIPQGIFTNSTVSGIGITNNISYDSLVELTAGNRVNISNNKFTGTTATTVITVNGNSATRLRVDDNNLGTIGCAVLSVQVTDDVSICGNKMDLLFIKKDLTNGNICNNVAAFGNDGSLPLYTNIIFTGNTVKPTVEGYAPIWKESIISDNIVGPETWQTIITANSGTGYVTVTDNIWESGVTIQHNTAVTNVIFSNNTSLDSSNLFLISKPVSDSVISNNKNFKFEFRGASNTVISGNINSGQDFTMKGVTTNCIIENNQFDDLILIGTASVGESFTNNVLSNNRFAADIQVSIVAPGASTKLFTSNIIIGNRFEDFRIFDRSIVTSTLTCSDNIFYNNIMSGGFAFFENTGGLNFANATFTNNRFIGNRYTFFQVQNSTGSSTDILVENLIVSNSYATSQLLFDDGVNIDGFVYTNNVVESSLFVAPVAITIGVIGTSGLFNDVTISNNYLVGSENVGGSGIQVICSNEQKPIDFTNWIISNNRLVDSKVRFQVGGDFDINLNNFVVSNNIFKGMDIDGSSDTNFEISNFVFTGNICTEVNTNEFTPTSPGLYIEIAGTTGVQLVDRVVISGNSGGLAPAPGTISIDGPTTDEILLQNTTINNNTGFSLEFRDVSMDSVSISNNMCVDGYISWPTGINSLKRVMMTHNSFADIGLPDIAHWDEDCKITFNYADNWGIDNGGSFSSSGVDIDDVQVWGNTGNGATSVTFGGTGNDTTANANDIAGTGTPNN